MTLDQPFRLLLPWPPTVNTYWRAIPLQGRVRVLISAQGQAYARAVALECRVQRAPKLISSRLAVRIYAEAPDTRQRDLDNLCKGLLDALTKAAVWMDDSQIDDLRIVRGPRHRAGRITLTISPATLPDELRLQQPAEAAA